MDIAQNILGALAPKQQDQVKSNWSELLNVNGGNKQNLAMDIARHAVTSQLLGGGSSKGSSGGGLGNILGGVSKLFGKKEKTQEAQQPANLNPLDIVQKAAPLIGGLDSPNALIGFFSNAVLGSGQASKQSESSIFEMLKQIIFGLLSEKLAPQSFSQNSEAKGAWSQFLQLAAGAIKKSG